jgi:DNA-directed RNA polymerase subunit RPC12/RpoP
VKILCPRCKEEVEIKQIAAESILAPGSLIRCPKCGAEWKTNPAQQRAMLRSTIGSKSGIMLLVVLVFVMIVVRFFI